MSAKIQGHTTKIIMLCAIAIGCALLTVCIGCEKAEDVRKKEFEIDQSYERGPLKVHVRVDKGKLTIAETLLLEFEASVEPGYELKTPEVEAKLEDFGIVDWLDCGDRLDEKNNVIKKYQYRLEPFLSGNYQIPPFTFEFHDANDPEAKKYELVTEPVDIEVTSLLGEQHGELVIADIEDIVEMPATKAYLWWTLGAAGVIAAVGVWLYLRRKRVAEIVRIFKPAHEIALWRLQALIEEDLVKAGEIKEFYERISNILRCYIEHRFDLRAPERTTEEFLSELAVTDVLAVSDKNDLAEFLKHCDLVKFARHSPTDEQIQRTFDMVTGFIEKTRSDEKKIDVTETNIEQTIEVGNA